MLPTPFASLTTVKEVNCARTESICTEANDCNATPLQKPGHLRRRCALGTTSWSPPRASYLFVPAHLVDPRPVPDPVGDIVGVLSGLITASSGDGVLILSYLDGRVTAPVAATSRGAPERKVTEFHMDPDITRLVCNPVSGELFRLPDIDGTKQTLLFCYDMGLVTRSAAGHGPPDRYAAAALRNGDGGTFVMRRFLSQTGEWEKLAGLPSPLYRMSGRWTYTLSDRPELRFVELPRGSVRPGSSKDFIQAQGLLRRLGVSEGRLRYVEVSQKDPHLLSSFALDNDGCCWTLEHQVALGRLLGNEGGQEIPRIAVIDPLDASFVYVIIDKYCWGRHGYGEGA
ncbi:hypothetical protein PR202_ga05409 [Eleusine coracana subsp. coracana]|uniref:DUF1618 domain-containing protein n=1 Tax=Eleusine coracana subsp. coracana TaxID=191504 RepID=A0AAV5BU89_ELECO|nr:hypothetical protein PR202_ga04956 [Eleusine coracana subsp. coracana]GJM89240.1 hypothetical protein PR202_ga05409 [Eleusine coracana subsp. coracana]